MAQFDTVYLSNPSGEKVEDRWDGETYSIGTKEIIPMTSFVASNFVAHDKQKKEPLGLKILALSEVNLSLKNEPLEEKPKEEKKKPGRPKKEEPFADLKK